MGLLRILLIVIVNTVVQRRARLFRDQVTRLIQIAQDHLVEIFVLRLANIRTMILERARSAHCTYERGDHRRSLPLQGTNVLKDVHGMFVLQLIEQYEAHGHNGTRRSAVPIGVARVYIPDWHRSPTRNEWPCIGMGRVEIDI